MGGWGRKAGGQRLPGSKPPPRAGPGAHLAQNKGRMHLRRRGGPGPAAGAYLGLRGFLRGSVCRAGRDQDGPIGGRGRADESRRRRPAELLPGQVRPGLRREAGAGGLGREHERGPGPWPGSQLTEGGSRTAGMRAGRARRRRRRRWRRRVGLARAPLVAMETSRSRVRGGG